MQAAATGWSNRLAIVAEFRTDVVAHASVEEPPGVVVVVVVILAGYEPVRGPLLPRYGTLHVQLGEPSEEPGADFMQFVTPVPPFSY